MDTEMQTPQLPPKKSGNALSNGLYEIAASFLNIFHLAYKGFYYPFKFIFDASSKKVDDTYRKTINKTSINKQEEDGGLTKIEIWDRKLKDKLGITQRENAKLDAERRKLQEELATDGATRTTEAKVYIYKVRDRHGRITTGRFTAFSKMDVNSFLLNEGYEVYSIKNNKTIDFVYGQSSFISLKWSAKDLIFWLTQLSTYIKSGIPLTDAIKILVNQMGKNKSKKTTMQSIAYELTMGNTFSNALEKQGGVFPTFLINMLRTAEATGDLETTLDEMADYYKEIESTRKEMINALTYPCIIMVFAICVVCFIILYVVPKFKDIYESNNIAITGITKLVLDLSNFLENYIFTILFIVIIIVLGIMIAYKEVKVFRRTMQVLLMKIPVISQVIIYNEMAIFSKTFSSLLKNNVFITDSIDILSKITNNEIYKEIMFETINNIAKGDKISQAFKNHWAIPEVAYYMIVTGESTGQLGDMLDTVSKYYQEEHKTVVAALKSFIEPITIIFLAVIVGGIIISVIVPMFNMYNQIA